MKLNHQKRLLGDVLKSSKKRVRIDPSRTEDLKEAITKQDIRGLVADNAITLVQARGVSRVRARKRQKQRRKGLQKGHGKREGTANARSSEKTKWIRGIRAQRDLLKELKSKEIITTQNFNMLYAKAKGGFFRSRQHIKIFIKENNLAQK